MSSPRHFHSDNQNLRCLVRMLLLGCGCLVCLWMPEKCGDVHIQGAALTPAPVGAGTWYPSPSLLRRTIFRYNLSCLHSSLVSGVKSSPRGLAGYWHPCFASLTSLPTFPFLYWMLSLENFLINNFHVSPCPGICLWEFWQAECEDSLQDSLVYAPCIMNGIFIRLHYMARVVGNNSLD